MISETPYLFPARADREILSLNAIRASFRAVILGFADPGRRFYNIIAITISGIPTTVVPYRIRLHRVP
jgi:hypothetical protein